MTVRSGIEAARTAPVIVAGMHRSGTSAVVQALERLGLFMGWRNEQNREPLLFIRLNDWLLHQASARWDRPPEGEIFDHPDLREALQAYLRRALSGPRTVSYLGPFRYLRFRSLFRLNLPWGWKDPRSILTLPIWLEVFPAARIIHVVRHGADVAASLHRRENERLSRSSERLRKLGVLHNIVPRRSGFVGSGRCLSLEGAFTLWEEYQARAAEELKRATAPKLEVRYEELLEDPKKRLSQLAEFCNLERSPQRVATAEALISSDRRFAYRRDARLVERAADWSERLAAWGY